MSAERLSFEVISKSAAETFRIGRILGEGLKAGDAVALTGELGAGKTCLTQGIARGLGVPESYAVASPTFTLINEYPGRETTLVHVDLYRLQSVSDLVDMGYEEYLSGRGVMVVEWADRIREAVPEGAIRIALTYLEEDVRKMEISASPERIGFWEGLL